MNSLDKVPVTEISAFYASTKKSDKVLVEARDFYSISYRYSGKVLVETQREQLTSEKNSITFVPKSVSYKTEVIEDTRMAVIHFKLASDTNFRNASVMTLDRVDVQSLFEKVILCFHAESPSDFRCMAAFYELLASLEDISQKERTGQASDKIRLIKESMEREYADPLISITSLSDRFSISTSYLRRDFLKAYGRSPIAFLRALRIANAKNMLMSEYLSVADVAEQCGFSSASYFIQVFHQTVGESPERYRKRFLAHRRDKP